MKKMTYLMCCLALGATAIILPTRAKAQAGNGATDQDKQFLANASQANFDEIKLGELAESKAMNPDVKGFGHRMVKDHTMLTEKMKPFADAWGLTPPTNLDQDAQGEYDKLNGLSGKDFDKEYMDFMLKDHTKDLNEFTKEVNDTHDPKFKVTVEQAKSVIAAHKNMAWSLKKKL